jgi:hypothetical protein
VGDREGVIEGERGVVAAPAHLLRPDLRGDVDQQAAAVSLAVDVPGTVEHLLQRPERDRDRLVARGRIAANGRVERARILVLDARRGDEGAVRAVGGEALAL